MNSSVWAVWAVMKTKQNWKVFQLHSCTERITWAPLALLGSLCPRGLPWLLGAPLVLGGRFRLLKTDPPNCRWLSLGFCGPLGLPWTSAAPLALRATEPQIKQTNMILSEIYVQNYKSFRNLNSWTVQSQCSNVEATASTRADAPHTKLYIPSNINPRRKLLSSIIWADKKWTGFW